MDKITDFIKNNIVALIIGTAFYLLYLQFTFTGNRICDCETTEEYKPAARSGSRIGVNRFYHK